MYEFVEQNLPIVRIRMPAGLRMPASRWRRLRLWIRLARRDRGARRARRVILMLVGLWIVNGFDLAFTLLAVRLGKFQELNPITAPLMEAPGLLVAFKIIMVLFASAVILKFRRRLFTEIGCWGLCLTYLLLSGMWWMYYFLHH